MITRRVFLKNSGLAMIGTGALPAWLARAASAAPLGNAQRKKVLVAIFQRGAVDGLNVVIPYGESYYYQVRPTIHIPRPKGASSIANFDTGMDLDGFFAFHPALAPLKPLWDQRHLAAIQATGSPDPSRSHFDAQDYMESGTPGVKTTDDGWLNRVLTSMPGRSRSALYAGTASPLRAVAMDARLPLTLQGAAPAVAIGNLSQFNLPTIASRAPGFGIVNPAGQAVSGPGASFEAMYDQAADAVLGPAGQDTFEALAVVKRLEREPESTVPGANYPRSPLGGHLKQLARLIKADVGVEVAFADVGGWDNHVNEGGATGQLAGRLRDFGQSIAAFWMDLGPRQEDVVLVTMSEFGRTARENGNRGTDHGHANVMFVLGGAVAGGKVYGDWPGLDPAHLYQNRDLQVTTDFRDVLAEATVRHLGVTDMNPVFPGFRADPARFRGFLRG